MKVRPLARSAYTCYPLDMTSYAERLRKRWIRLYDAREHAAYRYGVALLTSCHAEAERQEDRYHRLNELCRRLHDRMDAADNRPAAQPTLVEALHALGDAHDAVIARRNRT